MKANAQLKVKDPLSKREDIIRLAYEVFNAHGFVETGVDKVFSFSGISKRTVYKYFRSKEDLISAAILHYQKLAFAKILNALEQRPISAKAKLLMLFDLKREELGEKDYSGCFAINAALAYQGKNPEIKRASETFLREVEEFIKQLCEEAECGRPAETAMQIVILFQGTILYGQNRHDPAAALAAKKIVQFLLK